VDGSSQCRADAIRVHPGVSKALYDHTTLASTMGCPRRSITGLGSKVGPNPFWSMGEPHPGSSCLTIVR
jgi:hypothetical protein